VYVCTPIVCEQYKSFIDVNEMVSTESQFPNSQNEMISTGSQFPNIQNEMVSTGSQFPNSQNEMISIGKLYYFCYLNTLWLKFEHM
jgi:hypothetical protein